jgi:predicted phosphoribosyltransferase
LNRAFGDRRQAGLSLAGKLKLYKGNPQTIILALPRGGVPVAYEVSMALELPLDVFIVRKLGSPGNPELAMGAIAQGGVTILNMDIINSLNIKESALKNTSAIEEAEIERRHLLYRKGYPPQAITGKKIILIDDGLATGATMKAAVRALRKLEASMIIVAVPVAPRSTCEELAEEADDVVCYMIPDYFMAVGEWYEDFTQTTDEEVRQLLEKARERRIE